MAVDEALVVLREQLVETYGAEGAPILLGRPPGGWSDLVTHQHLTAELGVLRSELRGEMAELRTEMAELRGELRAGMATLSASVDRRLRVQTWVMCSALLSGIGIATTVATVVAR